MNIFFKKAKHHYILIYGFLFFAIFFPSFFSILGSAGSILINGGILVGIILLIPIVYKENTLTFFGFNPLNVLVKIYIIYLILAPISMLCGVIFSSVNLTLRDFFDLHRPLLYLLQIIFFYLSIKVLYESYGVNKATKKIERLLNVIFIFLFVFSCLQFFKYERIFLGLYTKDANIIMGRSSAPFINPYDLSIVIDFFCFYFLSSFLFKNKKYIVFFLMAFSSAIFTQSRTGLIVVVIGCFFILPSFIIFSLSSKYKLRNKISSLILFAMLFVLVIISIVIFFDDLYEKFRYLSVGLSKLFANDNVKSLSTRKEQFLFSVTQASNSINIFLFGNGPAKSVMEFVESSYTYYFYRYGIFGVILYFLIPLIMVIFLSFLNAIKTFRPIHIGIFIWFLCLLVASIGNNFTDQVRLATLYDFFIALTLIEFSSNNLRLNNINENRIIK